MLGVVIGKIGLISTLVLSIAWDEKATKKIFEKLDKQQLDRFKKSYNHQSFNCAKLAGRIDDKNFRLLSIHSIARHHPLNSVIGMRGQQFSFDRAALRDEEVLGRACTYEVMYQMFVNHIARESADDRRPLSYTPCLTRELPSFALKI